MLAVLELPFLVGPERNSEVRAHVLSEVVTRFEREDLEAYGGSTSIPALAWATSAMSPFAAAAKGLR